MFTDKKDLVGISAFAAALAVGAGVSAISNPGFSTSDHIAYAAGSFAVYLLIGLAVGFAAKKFFSQHLIASAGLTALMISFASGMSVVSQPKTFDECMLDEMRHQPAQAYSFARNVCKARISDQAGDNE